jgi:hypothetical protein
LTFVKGQGEKDKKTSFSVWNKRPDLPVGGARAERGFLLFCNTTQPLIAC